MPPKTVTICVISDFVALELREPLGILSEHLEMQLDLKFSQYGAVVQQFLQPDDGFISSDLVVILLRLNEFFGHTASNSGVYSDNANLFVDALESVVKRCRVPRILIFSCPVLPEILCVNDLRLLETRVEQATTRLPGTSFFRSDEMQKVTQCSDLRRYFCLDTTEADMPYSSFYFATLATFIARQIHSLWSRPRKVISVDCDNSIWSGNCAELGPLGVEISSGARVLQRVLIQQAEQGKLICLSSKNNEKDVMEVFECNAEMLLKKEHISFKCINWRPKSENLEQLAGEIGLDLGAFIFLDDDWFECQAMRATHPEMLTVQLPADPDEMVNTLNRVWDFDSKGVTSEDSRRAIYYREDQARLDDRKKSPSLESFIASLNLMIRFSRLDQNNLLRAAQITQRVNQFNLNGNRHSEHELRSLSSVMSCDVIHAADRFGDYGMVGVIMYESIHQAIEVNGLFLSCRALGRGIEVEICRHLWEVANSLAAEEIRFAFRSTDKNEPIRKFLIECGALEPDGVRGTIPVLMTNRRFISSTRSQNFT
jgi:FkbH-like protein